MARNPNSLLLAAINQPVEIQPYDPAWAGLFIIERTRLLNLFPETFAAIEHIGSTAVPGLAAKPVIDILGGVVSMSVADKLLNPLCQAGYDTSKEFNATLKDKRWLMLHANGKRTHHLHLVVHGQLEWRRTLAFRDALRADQGLAARYETLKRNLAAQHCGDREAYTAAKSEFIISVVQRNRLMKSKGKSAIKFPKIVDQAEWQKARNAFLVKEKKATHARDALAAERRRLPMVRIDKEYVFAGPKGKLSLLDLFEGRRQLMLYHFMFAPTIGGWPDAGCVGCSMVTDQFGRLEHFHARDTSFCLVSHAPLKNITKFKKRMGWTYPWYSWDGTNFNPDLGLATDNYYGLSVFIHDDKNIYRTYFTDGRGVEGLNIWTFLDLTPLGRQEEWQDSPAGGVRSKPGSWWRRHDEYAEDSEEKH